MTSVIDNSNVTVYIMNQKNNADSEFLLYSLIKQAKQEKEKGEVKLMYTDTYLDNSPVIPFSGTDYCILVDKTCVLPVNFISNVTKLLATVDDNTIVTFSASNVPLKQCSSAWINFKCLAFHRSLLRKYANKIGANPVDINNYRDHTLVTPILDGFCPTVPNLALLYSQPARLIGICNTLPVAFRRVYMLQVPAVFVINLIRRPDKFNEFMHAYPYRLNNVTVVNAYDGQTMDANTGVITDGSGNTASVKHLNLHYNYNPIEHGTSNEYKNMYGAAGCFTSHSKLWEKIFNSKLPFAVIFEDDVHFSDIEMNEWVSIIRSLPSDTDICYLSCTKGIICADKVNEYIAEPWTYDEDPGSRYSQFGTYGYIVTYSGAMKLTALINHAISNSEKLHPQLDIWLRSLPRKDLRQYCLLNPIVNTVLDYKSDVQCLPTIQIANAYL